MILLKESDKPKSIGEKIAEYVARPPQPILRFYGDFKAENTPTGRQLLFSVRNGLPLPLFYGIYVKASHDPFTESIEKTDHIGPFSVDDWRLTVETTAPVQVAIRVGVLPFEIQTDKAEVVL